MATKTGAKKTTTRRRDRKNIEQISVANNLIIFLKTMQFSFSLCPKKAIFLFFGELNKKRSCCS